MVETNVPNFAEREPQAILEALSTGLEKLTPEVRKAATYVLDNPNDVGVSSIREIAESANVKPNTFVRLARTVGFEGFDDFRELFRDEIRRGGMTFPDRARWLQSVRQNGQMGILFADMVHSVLENVESTFSGVDETTLKSAAEAVWNSRQTFTLGVGVNAANAQNFTYLASTGMVQFHAIPRAGSTATDDLAWSDDRDVLIAITCKPYRREVLDAVHTAKEQGLTIISISDSLASPIMADADHRFVIAAETPQFFPSSVTTIALLEILLSFVIASASPEIVDRVDRFHKRRHQLGIYVDDV